MPMTQDDFARLAPQARGYAVYMFGSRDDEPAVPDEGNPYRPGSPEADAWDRGQQQAVLDVTDLEE
jgi:hypothetical protein